MFDSSAAFSKWRASLSARRALSAEQLDELEAHLRDGIAEGCGDLDEEEKFLIATHRLGRPDSLGEEYEKITPWASWRAPIFWATAGVAWVLGVLAILDLAVPVGALVAAGLHLPFVWMGAWAFVAGVGAPIVVFASVGAWMCRFSSRHPASRKALLASVAVCAVLRVASLPLMGVLNRAGAWKGFEAAEWRSFWPMWQAALIAGFLVACGVGALALVRFRAQSQGGVGT